MLLQIESRNLRLVAEVQALTTKKLMNHLMSFQVLYTWWCNIDQFDAARGWTSNSSDCAPLYQRWAVCPNFGAFWCSRRYGPTADEGSAVSGPPAKKARISVRRWWWRIPACWCWDGRLFHRVGLSRWVCRLVFRVRGDGSNKWSIATGRTSIVAAVFWVGTKPDNRRVGRVGSYSWRCRLTWVYCLARQLQWWSGKTIVCKEGSCMEKENSPSAWWCRRSGWPRASLVAAFTTCWARF